MKDLNVSVRLDISEINSLLIDLETVVAEQKRLGLNYSAGISDGILDKLRDAKIRWFQQLEGED